MRYDDVRPGHVLSMRLSEEVLWIVLGVRQLRRKRDVARAEITWLCLLQNSVHRTVVELRRKVEDDMWTVIVGREGS